MNAMSVIALCQNLFVLSAYVSLYQREAPL